MAVDGQQQSTAQPDAARPAAASPSAAPPAVPPPEAPRAEASKSSNAKPDSSGGAPATPPVAEAVRPVKYRHQWLQTPTHVEVSVHEMLHGGLPSLRLITQWYASG